MDISLKCGIFCKTLSCAVYFDDRIIEKNVIVFCNKLPFFSISAITTVTMFGGGLKGMWRF